MGRFKKLINKIYSEKELLNIISNSNSFKEIFNKLNLAGGPTDYKEIKNFCNEHNFDIININGWEKRKITRKCLQCGKLLKTGQYKFCSSSCSAKYNNPNRRKKPIYYKPEKKLPEYKTLSKEQLEKLLFEDNLSFNHIGKLLKTGHKQIQNLAKKLDIDLSKYKPKFYKLTEKEKKCLKCGNPVKSRGSIFCSQKCCVEYKKEQKYKHYLEHQDEFVGKEITYEWLKPIILKEQDYECAIEGCTCGTEWNGKELHFVLDHIDGDATNNKRENLRLVCPNCDSQLDTFKSRNKGKSTRKYKPYSIK